jgi:hypothetical protein
VQAFQSPRNEFHVQANKMDNVGWGELCGFNRLLDRH